MNNNVNTITNGTNYDTHLAVKALAGGQINLSGLTQIVDPNTQTLLERRDGRFITAVIGAVTWVDMIISACL